MVFGATVMQGPVREVDTCLWYSLCTFQTTRGTDRLGSLGLLHVYEPVSVYVWLMCAYKDEYDQDSRFFYVVIDVQVLRMDASVVPALLRMTVSVVFV